MIDKMNYFLFFLFLFPLLFSCSHSQEAESEEIEEIEETEYNLMLQEVLTNISKSIADDNVMTLGHMSDVHPFGSNSIENLNEFLTFFQKAELKKYVTSLICCGDISNGSVGRPMQNAINEINSVVSPVLNQDIPMLMVVGNHDSNINETSRYATGKPNGFNEALKKEDQFDLIIRQAKDKWNFTGKENACYYYNDFKSHKIRIIVLDFIDYPVVEDSQVKGQLKYNVGYIFSQKQLEWLYQTLFTVPMDYGVIIALHAVPNPEHPLGHWEQGIRMLPDIIHAYKTGTSYQHYWNGGSYPEFATQVNFDFELKGEKEFICWLGGHIHNRVYLNVQNQLMITTPALLTSEEALDCPYSLTWRSPDTVTQNSFNILQINRRQKYIDVTAFGAYICADNRIPQRTTRLHYE
jgi:predicted phosphodiesterase